MYPQDCTKCPYTKTCRSYYGALGCKFFREIADAILNRKEKQSEEKTD